MPHSPSVMAYAMPPPSRREAQRPVTVVWDVCPNQRKSKNDRISSAVFLLILTLFGQP